MLSRTERIEGFHRKVSRTEKELYELFQETEEAEVLTRMRDYLTQARQATGGIRFDHQHLCSRLEEALEVWITQACADRHLNRAWIARAEEAILHRIRMLLAQRVREVWGTPGEQ